MENEAAKRRLNLIAAHFAASDHMDSSNVLPMNCSAPIPRGDSRMYFSRQGSSSQAYFMKQVSVEQVGLGTATDGSSDTLNSSGSLNSSIPRYDSRMYFSRQGSSSQACFMRQVSVEQVNRAHTGVLNGLGSVAEDSSNVLEGPLFSRPAKLGPNLPIVGGVQPVIEDFKLSAAEPPQFMRPSSNLIGEKKLYSKEKIQAFEFNGSKWSPRTDVVESRGGYVVTVELPGVGIHDIRVEVNDSNLTVKGTRLTQCWQAANCSNESISAYHRREILQGPYQAGWPLPADVDKDHVSAEFVDGFLRITVPKK